MRPIAIACGDHAGIGPEVALKAVHLELETQPSSDTSWVLLGDSKHLAAWCQRLDLPVPPTYQKATPALVSVLDPRTSPLPAELPPMGAVSASAGLEYLRRAAEGCVAGEFSGVVTAPVSKESILRTGIEFVGQTEFLAGISGTPDVTMMLLGDDAAGRWLRVALVTTHLPLRQVADAITVEGVARTIRHAAVACDLLGLPRKRVAVCGLNPHAGEGGHLGTEEERLIRPLIDALRTQGIEVVGPLSADTVFHDAASGKYEAVVAMYHDQGLPPLKLLAFENGVNWTLGLPFPRTSPDHGTAFNIAGQGIAHPSSMRAALRLARTLARKRSVTAASAPTDRRPPTG